MGSIIDKKKEILSNKKLDRTMKPKGERLGWKSVSEYKTISIKEVVGNGSVVTETHLYQNTCIRLVL